MALAPDMYRFSVTLNYPMRDKLDIMAHEYSMSRSAFIAMLIKKKWEEDGHTDGENGVMIG